MTQRATLIAILVFALLARVAAALMLGDRYHFADEALYHDAARALLRGEGFAPAFHGAPGQPVLLAILSLPFGSLTALRIGHAAVAAIGCAPVYLLAGRVAGRAAAIAAALLYALDPLLVVAGGLLYAEAAAAVVLTGAVLVALDASGRSGLGRPAVAGLLVGMVSLFRPVALVLLPVMAAWTAVATPSGRRAAHAAVLTAACCLMLLPWTWRNYRVHGRLTPLATAGASLAPVPADAVQQLGVSGAIVEQARSDPAAFARRVALEFGHFWELMPARLATDDSARREALHRRDGRLPTEPLVHRSLRDVVSAVSFGVELALAVAGAALLWFRRRREAALLLGVIFAFALGYALFYGKLRYRIPILPLVFVCSGTAAAELIGRWSVRRNRPA